MPVLGHEVADGGKLACTTARAEREMRDHHGKIVFRRTESRNERAAARQAKNYRLPDCDLYVTLEPCAMCAGAILQARIRRVVYGAPDWRAGAAGSVWSVLPGAPPVNHTVALTPGVLADESARLLRQFFAEKRRAKC